MGEGNDVIIISKNNYFEKDIKNYRKNKLNRKLTIWKKRENIRSNKVPLDAY